eukprot:gene11176-13698_t
METNNEKQLPGWNTPIEHLKHRASKLHITSIWGEDAFNETIEKDKPSHPIKLVDIGVGFGASTLNIANLILKYNPNNRITAVDVSDQMINLLKDNLVKQSITNVDSFVMDGTNLQFKDNEFDYGMSFFGIYLFSDRLQGVKELYRVLKPGGKGLITTWALSNSWLLPMKEALDKMNLKSNVLNDMFSEQLLEQQMIDAGFKNVKRVHLFKHADYMGDPEVMGKGMRNNPIGSLIFQEIGIEKKEDYIMNYVESYANLNKPGEQMKAESIFLIGTK